MIALAGRVVPAAVLGSIGLVLGGNLLENAYKRFIQTPEDLANEIRQQDHKNVFLKLRSGRLVVGGCSVDWLVVRSAVPAWPLLHLSYASSEHCEPNIVNQPLASE